MTEFAQGVHRIEAPLGDRFVAVYVFVGTTASLIVDTGIDGSVDEAILPYLRNVGIDAAHIRYVVSTHCDFDHTGGNAAAAERFPNALFISHLLDQPMVDDVDLLINERYGEFIDDHGYDDVDENSKRFIREVTRTVPTDIGVVGGERLRLSHDWWVELVHTPGHSFGSLSVWDPRSRTIAIGDAVLSRGLLTVSGEPAFPPTYRYVDSYRATIQQLRTRKRTWIATAHYPLMSSESEQFLADSLAYTDEVESVVVSELERVGTVGATALEIIDAGHDRLGAWPSPAPLMYPIEGHLEALAERGRVVRTGSGRPSRWMLA